MKERLGLLMVPQLRQVAWNCVVIALGAQCATIVGGLLMPQWCVGNWDIQLQVHTIIDSCCCECEV